MDSETLDMAEVSAPEETLEQLEASEVPSRRAKRLEWLAEHQSKIAFTLVILWCLLPVAMTIYCFVMGATGSFPSAEELGMNATAGDGYDYNVTISTYTLLFRGLGVITLAFSLICTILAIPRLRRKGQFRATPWVFLLGILLVWSTICVLLSQDPSFQFAGFTYEVGGLSSYFIYAGIFLCCCMVTKEKHRLIILRAFLAVICYLALIMFAQETGNAFLKYCFPPTHAVVFNQFNHFGYLLCIAAIAAAALFMFDKTRGRALSVAYIAGFILIVYALLINDTFGSYLAAIAGLVVLYIFYVVRTKKRSIWCCLPAALFILLSVIDILGFLPCANGLFLNVSTLSADVGNIATNSEEAVHAGTNRMTLWMDTVEKIIEYPIFGVGADGFYGDNMIFEGNLAHNEFLQMAAYQGIPGFILYIAALLTLVVRNCKNIKKIGVFTIAATGVAITYLISSCFGNAFFNTAPYLWIFLGLASFPEELGESALSVQVEGESAFATKQLKGKSAVLGIVLVIVVIAAAGYIAKVQNDRYAEQQNELADISAIDCAHEMAEVRIEKHEITETETYWYDANSFSLVSTSEDKPDPYGLGTTLEGGGVQAYTDKYHLQINYDEGIDYTNSILLVEIIPATTEDDAAINIKWVN